MANSQRIGLGVAFGLLAGVVLAVLTGQWWLVGLGLALGAGGAAMADRRQR